MHDITQVEQFLHFLDPTETVFTFCFLDLEGKGVVKGYGSRTLEVSELEQHLALQASATLHVTLNRTNGRGHKAADIESVRVLCIDLDRKVPLEEVRSIRQEFGCHCVVESSPSKYHLYWRLSPTVSREQWAKYQLSLACYFNSDMNLAQVNKVIRVPGVERICKDGSTFTPTIKYVAGEFVELDDANILNTFPWIEEYYKRGLEKKKEEKIKLRAVLREGNGHLEEGALAFAATGRNNALYTATYRKVRESGLSEEEAIEWALALNSKFEPPMDVIEATKTAKSGWQKGTAWREKRREKLDKALAELPAMEAVFSYDYTERWLSENRFSAPSVVSRVLQKFDGHLVQTGNIVYAFDTDAKVWRSQKSTCELIDGYVNDCCYDTIKDPIFIESLCLSDDGEFSLHKKQAAENRFTSHQFVSGTISRVLASKRITRKEISTFDDTPSLLYCANGVLDMMTLKLKEAQASDYLLHQTKVSWDPTATCPWWENFLSELFAENDDPAAMAAFMRELFGYTLSGSIAEQRVFIHAGGGCNGKSKVLDTLAMLGGRYSTRIAASTLSKTKKAMQQEFNRLGAKIEGKRVVVLDDLDTNTQWNEGTVKQLTSAEIPARNLFNEERDIPNRSKIHIGCNQVPEVEAESEGIIRRICLINYNRMFAQSAAKEKEIQEMVRREAPGILRWAVEGYRTSVKGLHYPEETLIAAKEYRHEQFKAEGVVERIFSKPSEGEDSWHAIAEIMADVKEALQEANAVDRVPSLEQLGRILKQQGYRSERKYWPETQTKATFYAIKRNYIKSGMIENLSNMP